MKTTTEEHPAIKEGSTAWVFLWRYFTGHFMDGVKRERHHINASWWVRKHRFHRAIWRLVMITFPVGWVFLVLHSPSIRINLVVVLTAMIVPYMFHHGTLAITGSIPKTHTVTVGEPYTIKPDLTNLEISTPIIIGEDGTDDLDTALDEAMKNVSPITGKGRSSQVRVPQNSSRVNRD